MKIPNKNSCLSLFHINTCSLNKSFEDLGYLGPSKWLSAPKRENWGTAKNRQLQARGSVKFRCLH